MRPTSLIAPSIAAIVVAAVALVFAGGAASSKSGSLVAGSGTIAISNFMYSPVAASVKVGSTIVVTNHDSAEHTATSDSVGGFDSGALQPGQVAHIKLSKVGTFAYHCSFHAFMHGTLKVVP